MYHVVETPEHAVTRQAVVSTDVLQCLLHVVACIGVAQLADSFGQNFYGRGVLVAADKASCIVGVMLLVVEYPIVRRR